MHPFLLLLSLAACTPEAPVATTPPAPAVPVPPPVDEAKVAEVLAKLMADDVAAKAEALKAFPTVKVDEVDNKKRRKPKAAPKFINTRTSVFAYVVTDMADNVKTVLVQWGYVADDWLFFKEATVATGDFRATVTFDDPTTDNGSGEIWEYANLVLSDVSDPKLFLPGFMLPTVTAAKMTEPAKVTIRFEGREFYKDYEMKAWEKDSIKAALVLVKKAPTREDALAVMAAPPAVVDATPEAVKPK